MARLYGDITKPAPPLPQPDLQKLRPGVSLLLPLSRRGHGPGLIVLVPDHTNQLSIQNGVPSPLIKWAEEGYVVIEIQESAIAGGRDTDTLKEAIDAIFSSEKCDQKEKVGVICYEAKLWGVLSARSKSHPSIAAAVIYANARNDADSSSTLIPLALHVANQPSPKSSRTETLVEHFYPKAESHKFALPFQNDFDYAIESVSHTRNLTFLKKYMNGPFFDLEDIWEEHTYYEFADRSVEWTMSTMVQEPYVNHVPTLTGGIGREALTKFYRDNFIFNNSADTELDLISRTIGIDRVIDEFLFKFTHDQVIDWLLPGVPPTFKKASVPFTAVVNIRGDRLYHEHISWDQGTLLMQLGLMPEYLPYPYPVQKGKEQIQNSVNKMEYRVPVEGIKTAEKLKEKNSVVSNSMFNFQVREKVQQNGKA